MKKKRRSSAVPNRLPSRGVKGLVTRGPVTAAGDMYSWEGEGEGRGGGSMKPEHTKWKLALEKGVGTRRRERGEKEAGSRRSGEGCGQAEPEGLPRKERRLHLSRLDARALLALPDADRVPRKIDGQHLAHARLYGTVQSSTDAWGAGSRTSMGLTTAL
eukprot:6178990-Pleurochrysis_carterae.AAC.2